MDSNNRRIVKNSIFLLTRTIFLTLVTLYTLREVIKILGVKEFGLYTVVFGIVTMFTFINSAMMSATQRYFSIAIGGGKRQEIRNNFYCGLYIHIFIAIILSGGIYLLKDFFLNNILSINGYEKEALVVYHLAIISIFISLLQIPFSALITAYEKMQAFAYLSIFEGLLKLAVVYFLVFFDYNKVILYSLFLTIISLLIFLLHILYCYINFKKSISLVNLKFLELKRMVKGILNFMVWSLIGNLSIILRNQGANILLNVFYGLIVNAAFAISLTVMAAINALVASVSNAINPQIFKTYAEGNINKFYNLISNGTKYYIYFLSLLVIPLVFFMEFILDLWLKTYTKQTVEFCQLILIVVLVDSFSILLTSGIQANGNIKWNQIVTGILLCTPVPVTYFLYKYDYPVNSIFYIIIMVSFLSIFAKLYFINNLTKYSVNSYFLNVLIPGLLVVFGNTFLMYVILKIIGMPNQIYEFLLILFIFAFFAIFMVYFLGLNTTEKSKVKACYFRIRNSYF